MNELNYKAMSERIKKCRKELGYTQEQMSEILEISYSSYSKIENAFQKPSLVTVVKLSSKLKVSIDYLVFGNTESTFKTEADLSDAIAVILSACDVDKLEHVNEMIGKLIKVMKNYTKQVISTIRAT